MRLKFILIIALIISIGIACSGSDLFNLFASPTPIPPTPTPSRTPTPQPTPTPRETPKPTVLPTETAIPAATSAPYSITIGEDGWQQYQNYAFGFALALPPDWEVIDLTVDDLKALLTETVSNNPELESQFTSEYMNNLVAVGIKLIAIDVSLASLASGTSSNLNVLVSELLYEITLADYIELNVLQIRSLLGEDLQISQEIVTIGELDAGKITYQAEITDIFGEAHQVEYQQYLILQGRTQYVLTFTAGTDQISEDGPIFDRIANSFALTD